LNIENISFRNFIYRKHSVEVVKIFGKMILFKFVHVKMIIEEKIIDHFP
jgi:hypothetical protein